MIPEKSDENAETLEQQVVGWLATPTYRDERRYLENHPALLSSQTDVLLEQRIAETMAARASLLAQLQPLKTLRNRVKLMLLSLHDMEREEESR